MAVRWSYKKHNLNAHFYRIEVEFRYVHLLMIILKSQTLHCISLCQHEYIIQAIEREKSSCNMSLSCNLSEPNLTRTVMFHKLPEYVKYDEET